jgi:hypothetical protein
MFLIPANEEEVLGIITGLNNKKSTGIDDIYLLTYLWS